MSSQPYQGTYVDRHPVIPIQNSLCYLALVAAPFSRVPAYALQETLILTMLVSIFPLATLILGQVFAEESQVKAKNPIGRPKIVEPDLPPLPYIHVHDLVCEERPWTVKACCWKKVGVGVSRAMKEYIAIRMLISVTIFVSLRLCFALFLRCNAHS